MKWQLTTIVALGTVVAAGAIYAQTKAPSHSKKSENSANRKGGMQRQRMLHALNLTPVQKEHAKAIFEQSRAAAKPVREQMKQNRTAMAAAVKAGNKAQIDQLSADRGALMGKLTTIRTESMATFYKELTPEQKAKADQMQARIQARMHPGAGRGSKGGRVG